MTGTMTASPDAGRVHRDVVDIIAARTSYDESCLLPDSHLEGELGIDSVILESILGDVRERFGIRTPLPTALRTLRDLVTAVEEAVGAVSGALPAAAASAPDPGEDDSLLEAVVAATMRHTSYQRHQLDLDADFEGELGIDSVVLMSIVVEVTQARGLTTTPGAVAASTLRDLCSKLGHQDLSTRDRHGTPGAHQPPVSEPEQNPPVVPQRTASRPETDRRGVHDAVESLRPASEPDPGTWDTRSMRDFVEERDADLFAKARSFAGYLHKREQDQLYWYGMPLQSRCENRAIIRDEVTGRTREFLMFASNNYLGLANHPKVVEAICDATTVYGATNTGCRLIGGTSLLHKELERRLAEFKQRPACIVYPGGYSANIGAISALVKSYDALVVDKLNHMSIVDGGRLAGGVRKIFQHNDMVDLERVLQRCETEVMGKLIVVDGVFSMHGDICDLPEIVRLAREYGARVMVDDAHATGVLGRRGSGTTEHFGLKGEVDLELGTMSKTLAGMGGFVVGDEAVVDYLRFYSHSYVFAATIPAGVAAGLIAAIDVIESEPDRLAKLWSNIRSLRGRLREAGFDLENAESAILPIVIGDERRAMEMGRAVRARGLFCQTVVFPGVSLGDARLRISVTSEHTAEDIERAAEIFMEAGQETGVLPAAGGSAGSRGSEGGNGRWTRSIRH